MDFSLINDRVTRFSVGAVNVLTGNFVYFDNAKEEIEPEHIMASGALPPALPMVKIGTDYFWDGGIVSNTPLQHLLDQDDKLNTLVFQVDLFSARGDVAARHSGCPGAAQGHHVFVADPLHDRRLPAHPQPEDAAGECAGKSAARSAQRRGSAAARELADLPEITILHIIYQQKAYEGHAKDYEFSGTSMREHWQSGYEDTRRTLKRQEWMTMPAPGSGVVVHDVHRHED